MFILYKNLLILQYHILKFKIHINVKLAQSNWTIKSPSNYFELFNLHFNGKNEVINVFFLLDAFGLSSTLLFSISTKTLFERGKRTDSVTIKSGMFNLIGTRFLDSCSICFLQNGVFLLLLLFILFSLIIGEFSGYRFILNL